MMNIVNILTCFFEAMVIMMFINTYMDTNQNERSGYSYVISAGLLACAIMLSNFLASLTFANIIIIGISIFALSYLHNGKIISNILFSVMLVLIFTMTEIVTLFMITNILKISVEEATLNDNYRLLGIVLSKLFAFVVLKIICLKHKKSRLFSMRLSYWFLFIIITLTTTISINLIYLLRYNSEVVVYNNLAVWSSFGLLYSMFFSLYLYESLVKHAEEEKNHEILIEKAKANQKQTEIALKGINELKKFRHDMINHHIVIRSLLEKEDFRAGIKYMEELNELPALSQKRINTGNPVIDSIIDDKERKAREHGIEFVCDIQLPADLFVSQFDLCTILGNALDNCIEACQRLAENSNKYIKIAMVYDDDSVTGRILNSFSESCDFMQTSKSDKENHGFGISIIKETLAKYCNVHSFKHKDNEFVFSFVIFNS